MSSSELHELMFSHGVNLAKTPAWQRRGILVHKQGYEKEGVDRMSARPITTRRSKVVQNWDLPIFKSPQGREMLLGLIGPTINKYQ
jgi:tRNA(His) 5'-end guanylyltransferase